MAEQIASKVPQIRFKGFEEGWEEKLTGDLCDEFHSGKFISASEIAEIGKYPVYGGNGLRGFSEKYNHDGLYALIGRQGALCGNMNLFSGKAFFTEHAIAVQANANNETIFLYYLLGRMNLGQYSSQSAQPGLAVNKLQKLSPWVCVKTEQTQIGEYFRELDRLIGLHQRKHDKLVTLKKAMLQKMFPQPGATTPEIRFKGFSEPWEMKTFAEIAYIFDGTHQTPQYTKEGVMFLSVENIHSLRSAKFISQDAFKNEFKTFPQKGDVLMTRIGDIGTANVVESNEPIAYYVSLALLKLKSADPYFVKHCISSDSVTKALFHRTLHIAFPKKINKNEIEKVEIPLPQSKPEQQKIGTYLRTLDSLISKHATQLQKLQQIKSACLEKMFV
jgi:type I restriction enzyme S subunit